MKFRVSTFTYRLYIESDPIIHDGKECLALAEMSGRRIRMSDKVPPGERLSLLLHELRHCWSFHIPAPQFEEQEADVFSMIADAAYADLDQQGGVTALHRLGNGRDAAPPLPVVVEVAQAVDDGLRYIPANDIESWQTVATPNGERIQCAACGTIVAGGSVVTSRLRFEDRAVGWIVSRAMYCGHCGHLQCWDEGATPAGLPNGSPMAPPRFKRGREVDEFLVKHPQAAGMIA